MKESPFYHWDQESLHIVDLALEYESQEAVAHLQIIETSTNSLAIPQFGWTLIRTYQISSDRKNSLKSFCIEMESSMALKEDSM